MLVGMHPYALDLPDGRRLRSDLGLEHDLPAVETCPCAPGGDQARDPPPIAATAVADAGIDADLADEHVDGGHQVRVEFLHPHGTHRRVDRALRCGGQCHQGLTVTYVAGGAPGVFESAPHRQYQLRAPDER